MKKAVRFKYALERGIVDQVYGLWLESTYVSMAGKAAVAEDWVKGTLALLVDLKEVVMPQLIGKTTSMKAMHNMNLGPGEVPLEQ